MGTHDPMFLVDLATNVVRYVGIRGWVLAVIASPLLFAAMTIAMIPLTFFIGGYQLMFAIYTTVSDPKTRNLRKIYQRTYDVVNFYPHRLVDCGPSLLGDLLP